MKRTDRRSNCPTNFALENFGDSWSLLVLRDLMFKGKRTYAEFAASEERISTNILAARLKMLVGKGLVRRDGTGKSTRYSLTARGLDLLPMMLEMILWSARHDPDTGTPKAFADRVATDRDALIAEIEETLRREHEIPET